MDELFENPYFDTYENFEQFKRKHIYLARALKENFPNPEWKNHPIYYYSSLRMFAKHQIKEGAYKNQLQIGSIDFSDYLNYKELGKYFLEHLDKTKYYYNENTQTVVETAIHWELS